MKKYRKTKLKTMQRKQKLEKRITKSWVRVPKIVYGELKHKDKQVYSTIPVLKNFQVIKKTQDWNPDFPHELDTTLNPRYHVGNLIQNVGEFLKDLFCISDKILLDIRYKTNNNTGTCHRTLSKDGYLRIRIGASGGLRATTLIHEFLHAGGFDHEYDINGYTDYRSTCVLDNYSKLICKDIFGKKEVFLT